MSQNIKLSTICIALFVFLLGCSTVKRYNKLEPTESVQNSLVKMNLFDSKISDTSKSADNTKTLWNLVAEGQAELIKTLDKRNSDNEKFIEALNAKYLELEPD